MLTMKFGDKTETDLDDLASRVGAVEAIIKVAKYWWIDPPRELSVEQTGICVGIAEAIEILIKPVSNFFYSDCDTIAVKETDTPEEHEEPEGPASDPDL